jgi:glycosyltransferase involved in cell wall biosynthesis
MTGTEPRSDHSRDLDQAPEVRVSVVVPTYNRSDYLVPALESVFAQTFVPGEVIVVDDGSTDDTPGVLQSYGKRIIALHPGE